MLQLLRRNGHLLLNLKTLYCPDLWMARVFFTDVKNGSKRGGGDIDRRERKLRNLRSLTRFCVQARLVVEPLAGYSAFSSFFLVASVFTPTPPATTEAHKVSCSRLSTFHVAQVTISPWTKIRSSNEYKAIRAFFPSLESTHFFATILHQRWKVSPSIIVIPFRQGVPGRSIETIKYSILFM